MKERRAERREEGREKIGNREEIFDKKIIKKSNYFYWYVFIFVFLYFYWNNG